MEALSGPYAAQGNPVGTTADTFNTIEEEILSLYAQFTWDGEFASRPANLVVGARYEETQVSSGSELLIPQAIIWNSDNDFSIQTTSDEQLYSQEANYDHLLPAMDFSIELRDDLIGRVSFSQTIARPAFSQLFAADSPNTPPRPVALGGIATGTRGNPGLLPLESDNFDISLEWYYDDASYVSFGFFDKRVANFTGTGQTTQNLFGLRDPSSGAPGTRSGEALEMLALIGADPTDVNLFTLTALIDNFDPATARAMFEANFSGGALDQAFIDQVFGQYSITPNADDPLFEFEVTGPINNREGKIHGFEIAAQHFFGDSGFGVQANYTIVEGDVEIDVGADPSVDQFALVGLSDTANVTLIYENYGLSAASPTTGGTSSSPIPTVVAARGTRSSWRRSVSSTSTSTTISRTSWSFPSRRSTSPARICAITDATTAISGSPRSWIRVTWWGRATGSDPVGAGGRPAAFSRSRRHPSRPDGYFHPAVFLRPGLSEPGLVAIMPRPPCFLRAAADRRLAGPDDRPISDSPCPTRYC